jgi:high-affinity iron transporter
MTRSKVISGKLILIALGILIVAGVIVWQAVVFAGVPDPTEKNLNVIAGILSCGILVFREGLEAVLVLSAITATVTRKKEQGYTKGISAGVGLGFIATIATWFIVVSILSEINLPELDIQAATGLLAILVLLVVMNWFFHKVYWTGWISNHTKRGRQLVAASENNNSYMLRGFILLGFTAIYREGFEVVLFLQQLRLKDGGDVVLIGAAVGVFLTAVVAVLTFIAHEHLPYKKMLIFTGVLLGIVLLVMVGESVQEMQQANWIPTTSIGFSIPSWLGMWFAVFPNFQGLISQAAAALLVIGSYVSAQHVRTTKPSHRRIKVQRESVSESVK